MGHTIAHLKRFRKIIELEKTCFYCSSDDMLREEFYITGLPNKKPICPAGWPTWSFYSNADRSRCSKYPFKIDFKQL